MSEWSQILSHLLATDVQVTESRALSGGCISEVRHLKTREHGDLVLKSNSLEMLENFECESAGLAAIRDANVIRVPHVKAVGEHQSTAMILMEFVGSTLAGSVPAFEVFGRQLARLHQATKGQEVGWSSDNFLGAARQINQPADDWVEFVSQQRIGFQIRWAVDQGLASQTLRTQCDAIIQRMSALLEGREDETCLLHGDLWSGNYLFDAHGAPVLIDPAVYRGCREAEWGMITWFGNCPPEFENAYQSEWPMADGWRRRVELYRLYHQINHLNLFGDSYLYQCENTCAEILSA